MTAEACDTAPAKVAAYLAGVIARSAPDPTFGSLLEWLLRGPGRPLDPGRSGKWSRYVTETAGALGGAPAAAIIAAGAVSCLVAAADVVAHE